MFEWIPNWWQILVVIILASFITSVLGQYLIYFRMLSLVGGMSHFMVGGIGLGIVSGIAPEIGMLVFGFLLSILLSTIHIPKHIFDLLGGFIWSFGIAVGILLLSFKDGYKNNLMKYLVGNLFLVNSSLLIWFSVFCIGFFIWTLFSHRVLKIIAFDPQFAFLQGIPVKRQQFTLLLSLSIATLLLAQLVGILMLLALFSVPNFIAMRLCSSFIGSIFLSFSLNLIAFISGLLLSYQFDLPFSSIVIICITLELLGLFSLHSKQS